MTADSQSELAASRKFCEQVARQSGSSFYRSFWLLRPEKRHAMFALYAFARRIDDLSDQPSATPQPGKPSVAHRHASHDDLVAHNETLQPVSETPDTGFADWRELIQSIERRSHPQNASHQVPYPATQDAPNRLHSRIQPIELALLDAVKRFDIKTSLFTDMLDGMESDLTPAVRLADWQALEKYCYQVAGTVGLACLSIWRYSTEPDTTPPNSNIPNSDGPNPAGFCSAESSREAAIECGLAFQLTNILRDIAEDAGRDRIYLPADLLSQHGVSQASWIAKAPDGEWLAVVRQCIDRAELAYQASWKLHALLEPDGGRMFSLIWRSYRQLLKNIDANAEKLWSTRQTLSASQRIALLGSHFFSPAYARLSDPVAPPR
jgi:phytoene synthase